MRFAFLLFCLFLSLFAKESIDAKIKQTARELEKFDKTYTNVHHNLASTAKKIILQEQTLLREKKRLQELQLELSLKEQRYKENAQELALLKKAQGTLQHDQEQLRQELAFMLAKNVSLSLILDDEKAKDDEALITEEVFESLGKITRDNIAALQNNFSSTSKKINEMQGKITALKEAIEQIDAKHKEVLNITRKEKENLLQLQKEKNEYRTSVKKLLEQQNSLKSELTKLSIVKEDEEAKRIALENEKARQASLAKAKNTPGPSNAVMPKIKTRTDAYHTAKTKRYTGKKTISPLDSYSIVKRFGPYEDPIYHIKIFNESVSLRPSAPDAKVKNVLNGKVILAKETSMLNNVVIIEHDNGLHTIYAHLDKIAPTIKKGARLKLGAIIGRVNSELMFEVTQSNYHIDPLQLID